MKKSWLTWLGLGAACAICCAPLIAPLVASAAGSGAVGVGVSLFGLGLAEALWVAAIVAAMVSLGAFVLIRHRAAKKAAACACAPPGDAAQCEVGGACTPRGVAAP